MLTENKFSKYLLYAIGEIILVVIGILIALQLNTNKENKEKSDLGYKYLTEIKKEVQDDIFMLYGSIGGLKKALKISVEANFLRVAFANFNSCFLIFGYFLLKEIGFSLKRNHIHEIERIWGVVFSFTA